MNNIDAKKDLYEWAIVVMREHNLSWFELLHILSEVITDAIEEMQYELEEEND